MYEDDSDDLRTWKAMPLWMSFLAAIIIPVIIAIIFAILGSKTNPVLLQIELILVAIAFCLTGILTRSKLRGLLSIFSAPISWVILFLLDVLTAGWIANPFGQISALAVPILGIAETSLGSQVAGLLELVAKIAIIIDIIIVEIMAFFLGFLLGTFSTGIWNKKGQLSIFSIIMKPLAAIFIILILISVPFIYHGISNLADGGISLGAGAAEFMSAFGVDFSGSGGTGAQGGGIPLDLNDPIVVENLIKAATRAATWFKRSAIKFDHVQGNFLINMLVNAIFPEGSSFEGLDMRKITLILDIADILADISEDLPSLLAGYQNMVVGFNKTFGVLSETSIGGGSGSTVNSIEASYDPTFNEGLEKISAALDNFTDAREGVLGAISMAETIIGEIVLDESKQLGQFVNLIGETGTGYTIILNVANGSLSFLNATYKTTLAIEELGVDDFSAANSWLSSASNDLTVSNSTLQAINITGLDPNSPLPFWGTVRIIQDMVNLLAWFSRAAANATEVYIEIENVLESLDALDFQGSGVLNTDWTSLSNSVDAARVVFEAADFNIQQATYYSNIYKTQSYGEIMDDSLKPMLIQFSNMLSQFSTNVTEIGYLLLGLEYTVDSIQYLSQGFKLFNQTYTDAYNAAGGDAGVFFSTFNSDPRKTQSIANLTDSKQNATDGWYEIDKATVLPSGTVTVWKNILHNPSPELGDPDIETITPSIAGLAHGILDTIALFDAAGSLLQAEGYQDFIQNLFNAMENVTLTGVFSGGGG